MYMAPEQFNGMHLDEKVDVYALGCIFNECFTRRQPWQHSPNFFQVACLLAPTHAVSMAGAHRVFISMQSGVMSPSHMQKFWSNATQFQFQALSDILTIYWCIRCGQNTMSGHLRLQQQDPSR